MAPEGRSRCPKPKKTLSELILSAVFYLQRKNGLTDKQIACYVARKRCLDLCDVHEEVKIALKKARKHCILSKKCGKFRIEPCYEDKLNMKSLKERPNSR